MIRKIVFIVSLIALIVSAAYMISYFGESNSHETLLEETRESFDETLLTKDEEGTLTGFEALLSQNPDTKGWITIPGTPVDNPIVQCDNNDFYLTHDFDGTKSRYGTLFIEAENTVTAEKTSQNLVIYGHEMRDGTMFGSLKKFRNVDFYKENPVFSMSTLYGKNDYKIFAVIITNSLPEHDKGNVFEYRYSSFATQTMFLDWIDDVKERSIINTGVDVEENDKIVTLSTCCGDFENARLVIFARSVRNGESKDIDLDEVSVNGNPRYPQVYYDKKGIKNPYEKKKENTSSKPQSSVSSEGAVSENSSSEPTSSEITSSEIVSSETTSSSAVSSEVLSSADSSVADNSDTVSTQQESSVAEGTFPTVSDTETTTSQQ